MNERVFRSQSNMLYLAGGSNAASMLYTKRGFDSAVDPQLWRDRVAARSDMLDALNIQFCQLLIPEKMTVYPLSEVDRARVFGQDEVIQAPGGRLLSLISDKAFLYPDVFLLNQTNQFAIYPATDSHWSWVGAFSAFQCIVSKLKYQVDFFPFLRLPRVHVAYRGDLCEAGVNDLGPEVFERVVLPEHIRRVYCNSIVGTKEINDARDDVGLHVGSHCIFTNPSAQIKQSVALFGTSFSEYRLQPSLLTAIFSYFFQEVHFVWSTSLDVGYIQRNSPNIVVAELPERFLTYCPDDSLNLEMFAAARVEQWHAANTRPLR